MDQLVRNGEEGCWLFRTTLGDLWLSHGSAGEEWGGGGAGYLELP